MQAMPAALRKWIHLDELLPLSFSSFDSNSAFVSTPHLNRSRIRIMDGVSSASAIIAVAAVLTQCCGEMRRCHKTLRNARKEVRNVIKVISEFSSLLLYLNETLHKLQPEDWQPIRQWGIDKSTVENANSILRDMRVFLDDLQPLRYTKQTTKVSRNIARVRWYFKKSTMPVLLLRVESSKSSLHLMTSTIQLNLALKPNDPASSEAMYVMLWGCDIRYAILRRYYSKALKQEVRNWKSITKSVLREYTSLCSRSGMTAEAQPAQDVANATLEMAQELLETSTAMGRGKDLRPPPASSPYSSTDSQSFFSGFGRFTPPEAPNPLFSRKTSGSQAVPNSSRIADGIDSAGQWFFDGESLDTHFSSTSSSYGSEFSDLR